MNQIKTIDVTAYEWFDKVNGNSYFAGNIVVNYGTSEAYHINMPFQYGYGDQYRHAAFKALQAEGLIPETKEVHWRYYDEHGIIYRHVKNENCRKRELMSFK